MSGLYKLPKSDKYWILHLALNFTQFWRHGCFVPVKFSLIFLNYQEYQSPCRTNYHKKIGIPRSILQFTFREIIWFTCRYYHTDLAACSISYRDDETLCKLLVLHSKYFHQIKSLWLRRFPYYDYQPKKTPEFLILWGKLLPLILYPGSSIMTFFTRILFACVYSYLSDT